MNELSSEWQLVIIVVPFPMQFFIRMLVKHRHQQTSAKETRPTLIRGTVTAAHIARESISQLLNYFCTNRHWKVQSNRVSHFLKRRRDACCCVKNLRCAEPSADHLSVFRGQARRKSKSLNNPTVRTVELTAAVNPTNAEKCWWNDSKLSATLIPVKSTIIFLLCFAKTDSICFPIQLFSRFVISIYLQTVKKADGSEL